MVCIYLQVVILFLFADGVRLATNRQNLASARAISNAIQQPLQESTERSQMLPFFGQFLAHDLTLTLAPEEESSK